MPAFFKFLSVMTDYYQPLSRSVRDIYWEGLKTFSLAEIKKAFWQHVHSPQDGKFIPKISDFVRYIEGTAETRAMIAWTKIEKAMKDIGGYESIVFDDPVILMVIRHLGGWIKLCQTKTHERPFIIQQFAKLYQYYERHPEADSSTYLCGIFEHENDLQGFLSPPPVSVQSSKTTYPHFPLRNLPEIEAAQEKEEEKEEEKKEKEKNDE